MNLISKIKKAKHDLDGIIGSYETITDEFSQFQIKDEVKRLIKITGERINKLSTLLDDEESGPTQATECKIFLQFAMRLEAKPLLTVINAQKIHPEWAKLFPFEFYEANFEGINLIIGIAGVDPIHNVDSIGSVPAAVLAQMAITHLKPALVLNAGTCGGFQAKGHEIAQVFVGNEYVAFHHRRSSIPAMKTYGIGKYPVSDSAELRQALSLSDGIVSSGDALDYSKEDQEYISENGGSLKEMEAAAIGWVCSFTRTPLLPIKTVTDWVDHPSDTAEQFKKNYAKSIDSLTTELLRILKYLSAHPKDRVWG